MAAVSAVPLSLYLHLPWCARKCPYCDFNSHVWPERLPEDAYLEALLRDLELDLGPVGGRPVVSVFFGGGTPSLLGANFYQRLLAGLRQRLSFAPAAEITLEANPGTVDETRLTALRRAGVNRLSLGIQSFDDAALTRIGRIHDARQARAAVAAARSAGFDNLNLDLMFGLPGQDPAGARADVEEALRLEPEHVSYYELTVEPGTPFGQHPPPLPDEDARWAMQEQGMAALQAAGLERYEISNYARRGRRCEHNLNYWTFGDYLGLGAGAHGKLSGSDGVRRSRKESDPARYLATAGSEEARSLSPVPPADLAEEFLLNTLRLVDGFPRPLFEERTGLAWEAVGAGLGRAAARGLVEETGRRVRATPLGLRFLDELLAVVGVALARSA